MRVLRLFIRNSGVFSNTLIDFTDNDEPQDLLCLAGVNGSGKTTIMDLILNLACFLNPALSIRGIFFDRLKPNILTMTEFAQLDLLFDNKIFSLVVGDKNSIQRCEKYPQAFIIENEIKSLIEKYENTAIKSPKDAKIAVEKLNGIEQIILGKAFSDREITRENNELFQELLKTIGDNINKEHNPLGKSKPPSIYLFNAHDREIQDIRYASIPKDDSKYEIAHRYNPMDDDLKKLLIFYDYAYSEKFEELKTWLNNYVLEDKIIYKIDRPEFSVVIKTKRGDKHGIERLSAGEESLLILATQLYLKSSENSILLIDEIDQSLHPEYQERIMRIIHQIQKEKNCQIILSSHSRFIWNFLNEKSIIRLNEVIR